MFVHSRSGIDRAYEEEVLLHRVRNFKGIFLCASNGRGSPVHHNNLFTNPDHFKYSHAVIPKLAHDQAPIPFLTLVLTVSTDTIVGNKVVSAYHEELRLIGDELETAWRLV